MLGLVIHNHPHRTARTSGENLFVVLLVMASRAHALGLGGRALDQQLAA